MTTQNLHEESHFEILSTFTAHFSGILKDWWTSLGDADKITFLTPQDFTENINILHLMFIEDVKESRETKRKEFFQMKCLSRGGKMGGMAVICLGLKWNRVIWVWTQSYPYMFWD